MSIVRADSFTRANVASGWGTATDGNTWTIQSGDGQSVASNEGLITGSSASTFATLGAALSGADAEGLVRFQCGNSDTAGVLLRWTDSSNHWLARYNGTGAVVAMVKVAGTYTTLSPSFSLSPSGNFYWLRFRCQGTTISFRVWQDGTTEPSSWSEQYTGQSSQNVAGNAGLYGFASSTNDFDHFSVDDLASGIALAGELDMALGLAGSLTVARALAGELDSTLGLSGALSIPRALQGRIDSSLGLAGALTVTRALAGALDSTLGMSGVLTVGNGPQTPEDDARRVPHRHIGRIEDQAGDSSLEGV